MRVTKLGSRAGIYFVIFMYIRRALLIKWSDVWTRFAFNWSREGSPARISGSRFNVGMVSGMKECWLGTGRTDGGLVSGSWYESRVMGLLCRRVDVSRAPP